MVQAVATNDGENGAVPATALRDLDERIRRFRAIPGRCAVAPHPDLLDRLNAELEQLRGRADLAVGDFVSLRPEPKHLGFNDGLTIPPDQFPAGTPAQIMRATALQQGPIHGTLRVVVVLVDFSDQPMTATQAHFNDLLFSTGVLPHGSVKEYYHEATNGLVDIAGAVVGPYRMPLTLAQYAHGASGTGGTSPNAQTMARDALIAADPHVDFTPYDNNGDGFVDAFIVVHAGPGAEQTGSTNQIWSHKWTIEGGSRAADGTHVYGYLTVPEDARIGVCAHELGHLLFGFPDLYDTDYTSAGIGNWCLMSGGSWNTVAGAQAGDVPSHPSAWCKVNQGWTSVTNVTSTSAMTIPDVKTSHNILRLWKDGAASSEYFLVENRQRTGYDAGVPGDGLLIWHIDESQSGNTDENHYKVALLQADGRRDLELNHGRGDAGDPYPGSAGNSSCTSATTPNTKAYNGTDTCVSISSISASGPSMSAQVGVSCGKTAIKDVVDHKRAIIDKSVLVDKSLLHDKAIVVDKRPDKSVVADKGVIEHKLVDKPFDKPGLPGGGGGGGGLAGLEQRVAALEHQVGGSPFIGQDLRPDVGGGAGAATQQQPQQPQAGDPSAKRDLDSPAV